jgi:uncharacterized protein
VSELFDEREFGESSRTQVADEGRRPRALAITVFIVGALVVGFLLFSGFWSEYLWYSSQSFVQVFNTVLWTRVGLFVAFGALAAVVLAGSVILAHRFQPFNVAMMNDANSPVGRYREVLAPVAGRLLLALAMVSALFAGSSATRQWSTFLLWNNRQSFGTNDPYFGRDVGFYVFSLPWYHYVVDFAMTLTLFAVAASAITHYLYGGIRLDVSEDRITGAAQAQLSAFAGIFALLKAVDYWLDRFDLLIDEGGRFTGMSYTDDQARLPARDILIWIAVICAVLLFINVLRRTWLLSGVGVGLFVLSSIILGAIWPAVVQRFTVDPSEQDRERPYIQQNIEATRQAYDIESAEVQPYAVNPKVSLTEDERGSLTSTVRLVDPQVVSPAFEQLQQVRGYYTVPDVLDVGRYTINGKKRDVVLAVRELQQSGIPEESQNWNNLHTVYTHGQGVIAAYADQRDAEGRLPSGNQLAWAESYDATKAGDLTQQAGSAGSRSQVYFGENSPDYSVVGKQSEGDPVELDLPSADAEAGVERKSAYDGDAGVPIGGLFNQLVYAVKFRDANLVLSSRVHNNSKILYDRNPVTMVEKIAPWLTVDSDPMPAIVDGQIVWILDGFTATDNYPVSESTSFEEMTTDSQGGPSREEALFSQDINYMRNSVKAVVDAYDGSVTLYQWDESDPIVKAWMSAFPDTVRPKSDIPEEYLEHMRYPEDLFKVQRHQLARYHVTNADDFYEGNGAWAVSKDPDPKVQKLLQPPYRVTATLPGDEGSSYIMTSSYTPVGRENLSAVMTVYADASDTERYGQLRMLEIPDESQVDGPSLMAQKFSQDRDLTDALLPFNTGSSVIRGNLLTLPIDDGLMYVQPIYTQRETEGSFPELQFVTVSFGDRIGFGDSIDDAIADALNVTTTPDKPDPDPDPGGPTDPGGGDPGTGGEDPPPSTGTKAAQIQQLLNQAADKFAEADRLQAAGDTVGWAEALEEARSLVERAARLAGSPPTSQESANPAS